MKHLLAAAAASAVLVVASPASAAPVTQPGGAVVDIDRIVLHTGADGGGGWASGYMEGSVTSLPSGFNQLWAHLEVDITVGCANRAGRSVRRFEQHHALGADWRAWNGDAPAGASWGPRIGLGEEFGMSPYPWEIPPASCPRGLVSKVVATEVTSARVQYGYGDLQGAPIEVEGVFSYDLTPPPV